ncbi:MAG TPA: hypothetical protein VF765_21690 [Polyangiaceae bacterium]
MNCRGLAWVLLLSPAVVFACGGKTNGGSDAGPGSGSSSGGVSSSSSGSGSGSSSGGISSSSSGSSSGGEPLDATPVDDTSILYCKSNGAGGSGGPGSCDISDSETCTDGTTYSVDCQCPQATCTCTATSANGGSSGGGFSYSGCPGCTTSDLFTICGFPQ